MREVRWVVALIVLVAGCVTDGESWARSTLGSEGAELIRHEARYHGGVAGEASAAVADMDEVYLRRPLVILLAEGDKSSPYAVQYHPLNAKLPDDMRATHVSMVRGIVVMRRSTRCNRELTATGDCDGGSEPFTRMTLVDRDRDARVIREISGHDAAVVTYLSGLPQSSPTASR